MVRANLNNLNTAANVDTFDLFDNIANGPLPSLTIQGGNSASFTCSPDNIGKGDINVRNNAMGQWVRYSLFSDGDTLNI